MKTTSNYLFFAVLCFALSNCKKDESSLSSLAGNWRMTDIHCNDGTSTFDFLGTPITNTYTFQGIDYDLVTTFSENPNEFSSTGSYTFRITTVFLGTPITEEHEVDAIAEVGEWFIEGDKLYQVVGGDTTFLTIIELTDSELQLRLDQDITFDNQGTLVTDKSTVFSSFERI